MFKEKLPLLEQKINKYKDIENSYIKSDSVKSLMITNYQTTIRENELKMEQLQTSLDKKQSKLSAWRKWSLGGFGITIGTILFLILR